MYSLGGVLRGGWRGGYHSPKVFIAIAGVHRRTDVRHGSLSVRDVLNEIENSAQLTIDGDAPNKGDAVIITLGTINRVDPLFAGNALGVTQVYEGKPENVAWQLACTDRTWRFNRRKVTRRYLSMTATDIAVDLVETYAPGFSTAGIVDGLETLDEITFTATELADCLTQIARRIGGYWKIDYRSGSPRVNLWVTSTIQAPVELAFGSPAPTPRFRNLVFTEDLSGVITRVYGEGGGANALQQIALGETIIPVQTAEWYNPTGGTFKSGPQIVVYTGRSLGGGGGLVGPGAAPSAAPALALASGSGVNSGSHDYAATFVTAAGESLPSPVASITTGVFTEPSSAPVAGTPSIGTGPNPGNHDYAVTFVAASGETTPGPRVTKATSLTTAPVSAPTPGTPTAGSGPEVGVHDYVVTFVTSIGETTPSPISGQVTVTPGPVPNPTVAPTVTVGAASPFPSWGSASAVYFKYSYSTHATSSNLSTITAPSPVSNGLDLSDNKAVATIPYSDDPAVKWIVISFDNNDVGGSGTYRTYASSSVLVRANVPGGGNLVATLDAALLSGSPSNIPTSSTAGDASQKTVPLTAIPLGDANVTSRKLYRRFNGSGTFKLVTTIANNTATTHSDTTANASLGADAPSSSTAYLQRIPLSAIPLGGAGITQRNIYRTIANGTVLQLAHTLADNTTTTWTDTVVDASLGVNAPSSNTAAANQVALSAIPIGGTGVTSRKLYRSGASLAQLKLLATIANNTTTTYTDSISDVSLGANAPTTDTSGLAQPEGQVAAGSTSLIVAGLSGFSASGGWAVTGNGQQIIRYTGVSVSSLNGIPASGPGSITASIAYNSAVTAAPQLTGIPASGVGAIQFPILRGDPINLYVQRDDVAAQATLAALIGEDFDGISEDEIQDRRLSEDEIIARCDALLEKKKDARAEVRYHTKDVTTQSGAEITVDLGPPTNIARTFTIQEVTVSTFEATLAQTDRAYPWYSVVAANDRFSLEDLLRRKRAV